MEFAFDYEESLTLAFDELLADPKLVLRNLPRVKEITKVGDMDYKVVTKEFVLHAGFQITGISHVKLSVRDNEIHWEKSPHQDHNECNGTITGVAYNDGHGNTVIKGAVAFNHHLINRLSWHFVRPMAERIGKQFVNEFIENFNDPVFENEVPE